ncbi:MAG: Ltp family lipoprotein [Solobacterium sp.]|nr:Ltp family lipoprotein [Solobacterium sp.]
MDDNEWVIVIAAGASSSRKKATHCELCGREMQTETFELSMEEKNAIRKAESYLSFMAFSRKGLIEQLEFEGFSTESSTMAVDALNVDWNKQAALKAKSYLEMMSFSRSGLIDQLLFEGFTRDQAEYGVSEVGY